MQSDFFLQLALLSLRHRHYWSYCSKYITSMYLFIASEVAFNSMFLCVKNVNVYNRNLVCFRPGLTVVVLFTGLTVIHLKVDLA